MVHSMEVLPDLGKVLVKRYTVLPNDDDHKVCDEASR